MGNIPTTPNEDDVNTEGSIVEILSGGSNPDICEETELTKFSRMLCDAQKRALEAEKAKGNKRKPYKGDSRTTAYRRKRYQGKLSAQGYLPIHEFVKRMASKNGTEELTTPQGLPFEESEESSDNDAATVSQLRSNAPSISESTDMGKLVQSNVASEDRRHAVPGLVVASEERCQAEQGLREEEEESTGSENEDSGTARGDWQNGTHAALSRISDFDGISRPRIVSRHEPKQHGYPSVGRTVRGTLAPGFYGTSRIISRHKLEQHVHGGHAIRGSLAPGFGGISKTV